MRGRVLVVALLAGLMVLALAGGALAKGASGATISGPGPDGPFDVGGSGEPGGGQTLGMLAERAGFFAAVFGQEPSPLSDDQPAGDLGPRYTIDWVMPGPSGADDVIIQQLYPYAENGPVTYLEPGQAFSGSERTVGGWYAGGAGLTSVLAEIGLDEEPPALPGQARRWPWVLLAAAGAVALGGGGALGMRARRRRPAVLAG